MWLNQRTKTNNFFFSNREVRTFGEVLFLQLIPKINQIFTLDKSESTYTSIYCAIKTFVDLESEQYTLNKGNNFKFIVIKTLQEVEL